MFPECHAPRGDGEPGYEVGEPEVARAGSLFQQSQKSDRFVSTF